MRLIFLLLGCFLLAAICVLQVHQATGLAIHEWLGLALAAAVLLHQFLHWRWIELRARAFFSRLSARARGNLLLNGLLLAFVVVATVSGVAQSEVVFPRVDGPPTVSGIRWHEWHDLSSHLVLVVVGIHLAFGWDRIRGLLGREGVRLARHGGDDQGRLLGRPARLSVLLVVGLALSSMAWLAGQSLPPSARETARLAQFRAFRAERAVRAADLPRRASTGAARGDRRDRSPGREAGRRRGPNTVAVLLRALVFIVLPALLVRLMLRRRRRDAPAVE